MNKELHISTKGEKLIHSFEGCKLKAYYDPVGVLTIGWGHTNAGGAPYFSPAAKWTQAYADEVFRNDIVKYEDAVKRNVKVKLTQSQFDALTSLVYNIGEGNFKKSQLLRKLNSGQYEAASREFAKWNKAGGRVLNGLTRRRAAEALMFQDTTTSVSPHKDEPMAQAVDTPVSETNPLSSKTVQSGAVVATAGATVAVDQATDSLSTTAIDAVKTTHELGLMDHVINVLSNPLFLTGLGISTFAGLIIYFKIRDM